MPTTPDLFSKIAQEFHQELLRGVRKEPSSLPFIRHEYVAKSNQTEIKRFQVLVIGGSVYKSAIISKNGPHYSILSKEEHPQPKFDTREQFLTFVTSHVDPDVSDVGINFAFPLTPFFRDGYLDGKLGFGTKEHVFDGLIGEVVGQAIEEKVWDVRQQRIHVGIANDTICLLLSGLTHTSWDHVAAGIVGTGLNFALFLDEHTLVNLESANFNKFTQLPEGKIVDQSSMTPGNALMEKEVSGAYLYQLFNAGISLRGLDTAPLTATSQIDELVKQGSGNVQTYAESLLNRSANLVAVQMVGITEFLDRDTTFVMEGSLFWKGYQYKQRVEEAIKQMSPHHQISFVQIPDSGILGAAKLVT